MSGPLSTLLARFPKLLDMRGDSQARSTFKKLGDPPPFEGFHTLIPPIYGDFQAARAALKGEVVILGQRHPCPALTPWDLPLDPGPMMRELHAFDWLADFAALGTKAARARALGWFLGWIDRYAAGDGPGWTPDIVARRLINILAALPFLEPVMTGQIRDRITGELPRQFAFADAVIGTEISAHRRLRSLAALVQVAACLVGQEDARLALTQELDGTCASTLLPSGAIPSRNPEALMHVLAGLIAVRDILEVTGHRCGGSIQKAIETVTPVLRALRLGDGSLARFHGGSGGTEGQLDRILASARVRKRPGEEPQMGYIRLHGGRTTAILDCARPQGGPDAALAHASTLGFELSTGRRPFIVNVGPGMSFGPEWYRNPRTTGAHNTLAVDKTSSSQLAPSRGSGHLPQPLATRPSMVTMSQAKDTSGMWVQARHDGYMVDYGLVHERRLFVSSGGDQVHGEDVLLAPDVKGERRFAQRIKGAEKLGVALVLHFHLHPEVEIDTGRLPEMIVLRPGSGEVWVFRQSGGLLETETSAWLDPTEPEPVATRQIVVRARTTSHSATLNWSFVRSEDKGPSLRDFGQGRMRG
ncbi:heparinase II/III family protein [Algicella marina]|uniref:Heparinase II/III-like C-terminal domain-containing protein n=1 Tax=Algicella marina TaxID=2683284 RepID=A0A6P1SZP6_9RHOB|nr:heparinase II/III family protein [Algicella marina]QHQ35958.1 hypothetical protein GO499_12650 [Algicella marina]